MDRTLTDAEASALPPDQAVMAVRILAHIQKVQEGLSVFAKDLQDRIVRHDWSKLREPELSVFTECGPKLEAHKFGTPGYEHVRQDLSKATDVHYKTHRHHPEHHEAGVNDMTLVDLLEMLADWWAASKRRPDGNIRDSIKFAKERFDIGDQLAWILENTARTLEDTECETT